VAASAAVQSLGDFVEGQAGLGALVSKAALRGRQGGPSRTFLHLAAGVARSPQNSRRFMGAPSSGLVQDITTPARKKAAVHHSKNCAMMSQMGRQNAKNSH